jgi:hypothetical protein
MARRDVPYYPRFWTTEGKIYSIDNTHKIITQSWSVTP